MSMRDKITKLLLGSFAKSPGLPKVSAKPRGAGAAEPGRGIGYPSEEVIAAARRRERKRLAAQALERAHAAGSKPKSAAGSAKPTVAATKPPKPKKATAVPSKPIHKSARIPAGVDQRFAHLRGADLSAFREARAQADDDAFARQCLASAARAQGEEPTFIRSPQVSAEDAAWARQVMGSAAKAKGEPGSRGGK